MNKVLSLFIGAGASGFSYGFVQKINELPLSGILFYLVVIFLIYVWSAILWCKVPPEPEYRYIQVPATKEWVVEDPHGRYLVISQNGLWGWTKNKFAATTFRSDAQAIEACAQAQEQAKVL